MTNNNIRVLVIEDDERQRYLLRRALENYTDVHCEVVEEERLNAGLGILQGNGLDAVILDLGLVDNTGLEGIPKLRAVSDDVVIFILSGHGHISDAVRAIRLGADDYWIKPVSDTDRLVWALTLAVERRRWRLKAAVTKEERRPWLDKYKTEIATAIIAGIVTLATTLLAKC